MPNSFRSCVGALLLAAAAACSGSSDRAPAVSADLEQDLAKAGGTNVQLAGSSANRVDVVSASERVESPTPAPKAKTVTRAPSVNRGARAVAPTPRRQAPAAVQPAPRAEAQTPAEQPRVERQPEPEPVPQSRPQAPVPSRQPEPRGGWKTPGEVIRNAPFPINP
jgi:outer membrane biosynthesis protein TonB